MRFRAHIWTINAYAHGDNLGRDFRTRREAVRYVRWLLATARPRGIRVDHVRPHPDGDYCRYWEWWGGEVHLQRWRSRLLDSWRHTETRLPLSSLETLCSTSSPVPPPCPSLTPQRPRRYWSRLPAPPLAPSPWNASESL